VVAQRIIPREGADKPYFFACSLTLTAHPPRL